VLTKVESKLLSRKFLLSIIGALIVFANDRWAWGLSQDTIVAGVGMLVAFIFGEAAVDMAAVKAKAADIDPDKVAQAVLKVLDELTVPVDPIVTEPDSE
jgi:hypothetical protein